MSYVPIQVVENRQGITPGVYLATYQGLADNMSYVLEHGPNHGEEAFHANVIRLSPQGFVKAIKEKQQEEIKRLQLEVDDLRAPVKLPGEVYDSFINIKKTYPETAIARVMEYIHIDSENHWEKLNDDFNTFAYWVDRNKSLLGRMMTYGYERGESAKEKWIKNMMALLNDPHIDQKGFLSGIYEQYQVADILKSLEGAGEGNQDESQDGCPET